MVLVGNVVQDARGVLRMGEGDELFPSKMGVVRPVLKKVRRAIVRCGVRETRQGVSLCTPPNQTADLSPGEQSRSLPRRSIRTSNGKAPR